MGSFSNRVKELRLQSGMTQDQLAGMLKVSRSTIGMYETGSREPDFETLEAIADIFNVNMDSLLGKEKDPTQKGEVSDDDLKFALFGGGPVTDAQYEEVKRFAQFVKERDGNP